MNDSWFFENFTGVPDDFFDDAMECFDIPLEDGESNDAVEDWDAKFQHLEPPPSNVFTGFSYSGHNNALKSKKSCSVLCNESSQPKQHKTIPLYSDSSEGKQSRSFWTSSSPVSVLESSSSSSSVENPSLYHPKLNIPVKRPRSKRPRSQRRTFPFIYALTRVQPENHLNDSTYNLTKKKQQKRKNLVHLSSSEEAKNTSQKPTETRKCTHCEVTKTPQWREGPMGPKTLCNACGVRYRSGRLFPEYRPAASPTFVPTVHSNSHRKVIEMRKMGRLASPPAASNGCPLLLPAPVPLPTE